MAFLTDTDYKAQIQDNILASVQGDGSYRADAERKAQEQMTSALNVRYDVPNIFNKSGDARNAEVVMYMIDITLYHLHSRVNPGQVPQLRQNRYDDAVNWLKSVAAGKLEPNLPKAQVPDGGNVGEKDSVQYGGLKMRNPYY